MRHIVGILVVPVLVFVLSPVSAADTLKFESGPRQTLMIELYTSEGCSSCPPAEAWLNGLRQHPDLWRHIIPLAFHVDYWDYLGWKDPFSRQQYSKRQRQYAREKRARTVYTPGFMMNGEYWRSGWFDKKLPSASTQETGVLSMRVSGDTVSLRWAPEYKLHARAWHYHVALLGMGLETRIAAGERAGSKAVHEFVVLEWKQLESQDTEVELPLPKTGSPGQAPAALVAWVSDNNSMSPLQSVGGYLDIPLQRVDQ